MNNPRQFKDAAYGHLAAVAKALGSARRAEIVDVLAQGPRTVEDLAGQIGQSTANTSQHLQRLARVHLVRRERDGTHVRYRVAPGVAEALVALRRLAHQHVPALDRLERDTFGDQPAADPATLAEATADQRITLLDVRPTPEFEHGHLPGARHIPVDELEDRLDELPADREVVAYCRGPWCLFARDAVDILRQHGRAARRLDLGVAEWRADGADLEAP